MLNEQERRGWVEAMKELKAQYYVGSQAAFNYLKAMRWYEQVRAEILQANPDLAQKFDLSVKKVAWLVRAIRETLGLILQLTAAQISSSDSISLASHHEIITPCLPRRWFVILGQYPGWHQWEINWPNCLQAFLSDTTTEIGNVDHLREWLREQFQNSDLQLNHVLTGQIVSYEQFCREANFRQGDKEEMLAHAIYLEGGDCELLNSAEIALLRQALNANDVAAAHSFLQRLEIGDLQIHLMDHKRWLEDAWERGHDESDDFLYDLKLFKRADNEYTLGHMEMERRILLSFVHNYRVRRHHTEQRSLVDEITEHLRSSLRESTKNLKVFAQHGFTGKFFNDARQMFREYEYLCRALHQNKRWLIQFLSH